MSLMPISVDIAHDSVRLMDMEHAKFGLPFFEDAVAEVAARHPEAVCQDVSIAGLLKLASTQPESAPDGLIFHTGRCGSTLLSNMLCAGGSRVLREPDFITQLIAAWVTEPENRATVEHVLTSCARLLFHRGATGSEWTLLKLSAWNISYAPPLLRAFPKVPALFLHREPTEVVASMLLDPPAWSGLLQLPSCVAARFFPSIGPEQFQLSPAALYAHAWRSAVEGALALSPASVLFVSYNHLVQSPEAALQRICEYLGLPIERLSAMSSELTHYSKGRGEPFSHQYAYRRAPLNCSSAQIVHGITDYTYQRLVQAVADG